MKICLLTTSPIMAGAEKQLYGLACGLHERGHSVLVITIKSETDGPLLKKLRMQGVMTKSLNMDSKWQLWKLLKLWTALIKFKPDILQSFLYFDNILARTIGRIAFIPIIISGQRNARSISKIRQILDRLTLPLTDIVVSNSKAGGAVLKKDYQLKKERIRVIPNGIDLPVKPNLIATQIRQNASGAFHIGFVGYLSKQKGVHVLLNALTKISQPFFCTIVGEGPARRLLERNAKKLGLIKKIQFLGHIENAAGLIPAFDLFVLPSLWEGMPNVIMEAMTQNVLVLASSVGGIPELINDNLTGFLVKPNDPDVLKTAIEKILNADTEKIKKQAKKKIEDEYTTSKMINSFENLYIELAHA